MGGVTSLRKGASFWYVPVFLLVSLAFVWMFAGAYPSTATNISLNVTNVNRGGLIFAFAQWNETINSSFAEYNISSSLLLNNYSCTDGCNNTNFTYNGNFTNYTIPINSSFSLGAHTIRIFVNSTNQSGDINYSNPVNTSLAAFYVWGWSNLTAMGVINGLDSSTNAVLCNVTDANTSVPVAGYPVSFSVNGTSISTNYTNATGWANITYNYTSQSVFNFTCSISDNATMYYNDTAFNSLSQLVVRGFTSRIADNIGINRTGSGNKTFNIAIQNYGNQPIVVDTVLNSGFLNRSSYYMEFVSNATVGIPANSAGNLQVNVTINTSKTQNQQGAYRGWIFLNSSTPSPFAYINASIEINLTNAILIDLACAGCGIFTQDSGNNAWKNISATENMTIKFRATFANGTELGGINNGTNIRLNQTSIYMFENFTGQRAPASGYFTTVNVTGGSDSNATDVIWTVPSGPYALNASVYPSAFPANGAGGYYGVGVYVSYPFGNVTLVGNASNTQLVINNTGLELTAISSKTISIAEGGNSAFFNVTAVNHGPVGGVGYLSMNGSCSYATYTANESGSTNCYAGISGSSFTFDGAQAAETVDANSTETCWFRWKITSVSDVSGNQACTLSVTSGSSNFGDVNSISVTVTDANSTTTTTAAAAAAASSSASTTTTTLKKTPTVEIREFPAKIEVNQGKSGTFEIKLKNTGQTDEFALKLTIEGIDSSWYTVSQTSLDLAKSAEGKFSGTIKVPETADVKDYDIKFTVANSAVTSRAASIIRVLPSDKTKQDINKSYDEYLANYTSILSKAADIKGKGGNVTTLDSTLTEAKSKMDEAKAALEKGDYFTASQLLSSAKSLLELAEKQTGTVEFASSGISFWVLAGIAAAAGIGFLVYMLLPPEEYMKGKSGPKDIVSELSKSVKEIILRIKIMLKKRSL